MKSDYRIYIENSPPFKYGACGNNQKGNNRVAIEEGLESARQYLAAGVNFAGLHHSDLDVYEAKQLKTKKGADRYSTFEYAQLVNETFRDLHIITAPHRVVVYDTLETLETAFRKLASTGIRNIVLVGKPQNLPPAGAVYRTTVEETLAYFTNLLPELGLNFGVIGIHTRDDEAERIADKFEAAGGRLRVMSQFIDDATSMTEFLAKLAHVFERRHLNLTKLEWNTGLAVFALQNRGFYTRLLRKNELACEKRLQGLNTTLQRIEVSNRMNLEFAERIQDTAEHIGIDVGFSIQPIIERYLSGALHPAVFGAADLAKRLEHLYVPQAHAA